METMEIRVVKAPADDSPEHVRGAWVGLVLPLAEGETGPRRETAQGLGHLRRIFGVPRWYYVVSADAALNTLERVAPAAAAWWRANAPERVKPGQTFEFPAAGCEKIIRLAVGSRELLVGTRPVPAASTKGFRPARLRREGDDRLVFRPTGWRFFSLIWFLASVVFTGVSIGQAAGAHQARHPAVACFAAILVLLQGIVFLAIGVGCLVLPSTYEFDRTAGVFRVTRLGSRRERPLCEVVAVQFLGHRVSGRGQRLCYQLNLVLLGDRLNRLCLSDHNRWQETRADGMELANFLGVPLLDGVSGGTTGREVGIPRAAEPDTDVTRDGTSRHL